MENCSENESENRLLFQNVKQSGFLSELRLLRENFDEIAEFVPNLIVAIDGLPNLGFYHLAETPAQPVHCDL